MIRLSSTLVSLALTALPSMATAQTSEFRLGVMLLASRQNVLGTAGLDHASGSIGGAELLARNEAAGLYARYLTGEVGTQSARGSDGHLRMADLRLMLGPPVFSIEGGYTLRARSPSLAKPRDDLIRGGARSSIGLGPSGFSLSLSASALVRLDEEGGGKKPHIAGWEGQSAVLYQTRHLPFYFLLGYRYERLSTEKNSPPVLREELGSIQIGAGLRHLGVAKQVAGTAP